MHLKELAVAYVERIWEGLAREYIEILGKYSQAEIQVEFVKRVSRNWYVIDQLNTFKS